METSEVSQQAVAVFLSMKSAQGWLTNADIAMLAKVPARTVRAYTKRFVDLGLVDIAEVFPAHRYRWAATARQRNKAYLLRLEKAAEVFRGERGA